MLTTMQRDADFAEEVLSDLYVYPPKRRSLAWLSWASLGWFGAHRFYLGRPGTALVMLFTGGAFWIWWLADAFLIERMVRAHNSEQERREREGLPPLGLEFMPALNGDVLRDPPRWTEQWKARSVSRRRMRLAADVGVLLFAAIVLGSLAAVDGVEEAIAAIVALIAITALGDATGGLERLPGARTLLKWTHRLRLFYYFNEPKQPLGLLFRSVSGAVLAPFRRQDRAEVRLYIQIGFMSTLVFLLLDIAQHVLWPWVTTGASVSGPSLLNIWLREAGVTFFVTYAFAAPIGAILTVYLLTSATHTLPRLLAALTVVGIVIGW